MEFNLTPEEKQELQEDSNSKNNSRNHNENEINETYGEFYDRARRCFIQTYVQFTNTYDDFLDPKKRKKLSKITKKSKDKLFEEGLLRFQNEIPNIQHAIDKATDIEEWSSVIDICDSLKEFYFVRGYWEDLQKTLKIGLKAAQKDKNINAQAISHFNLARVFRLTGNIIEGIESALKSLEIFSETQDKWWQAHSCFILGFLYRNNNQWTNSIQYLGNALKLFESIPDSIIYQIEVLNILGLVYKEKENSDLDEAKNLLHKSLELQKEYEIEDSFLLSKTLSILGKIHTERKEFKEAINLCKKSLKVKEKVKDRQGLGACHNDIGKIYRLMGRFDEAYFHYNESLKYKESMSTNKSSNSKTSDDKHGKGLTHMELGLLYQDKREHRKSIENWNNALDTLNHGSREYQLVKQFLSESEKE